MAPLTIKSVAKIAAKTVLITIATIPCLCIIGPPALIIHHFHRANRRHPTHKHRDRHHGRRPIPLKPRGSDSVLTLPLSPASHSNSRKHTTSSQEHCLLLMKLPIELRKSIWEFCLGGKTIHLTTAHYRGETTSKLVYIICLEDLNHKGCFSKWLPFDRGDDNGNMIAHRPWQNSKLLALVLTCRQMLVLFIPQGFDICANNALDTRRQSTACMRATLLI